jgi:DNA-binding NarL/FixJ family response regulator
VPAISENSRNRGDGDSLLSPSVTRKVIQRMVSAPRLDPSAARRLGTLTQREREVLEHVARGLSNAEIAHTLRIEESTIKTHMKRILAKLELRDRIQAVILAYETALVRPGT